MIKQRIQAARATLASLRTSSGPDRSEAVRALGRAIEARAEAIQAANERDLEEATELSESLRDRLRLGPPRIRQLVQSMVSVAELADPLGSENSLGTGAEGIAVSKRRIPLGLVAVVYEARPNVTAECAALAIKSGNAIVLRGGKEARFTNEILGQAIHEGLGESRIPKDAVQVIAHSTREDVKELLQATGQVDLVIPRGGERLMALVDEHAKVPVIRHGQGVCQIYVDRSADLGMATEIVLNAKVQRPSVCNALETLLVDAEIAEACLSKLGPALQTAGVELWADERARPMLEAGGQPSRPADETTWKTEFHDLQLGIRVVDGLDAATQHIDRYGTYHTASIVAEDREVAESFLAVVDASCVLWNASTRFNDGGALGLGAEIGISTTKMHAYGPMALTELTAEKFVVRGTGQVRA